MLPSGLSIRCSRWARLAILATAGVACAAAEAPDDPNSTTSRPAHSASTQPEPTSAKVQLFATQAQGGFREALALTRQEAQLLAKVEDRTDRLLDDPALYMMLAHVTRLPRMSTDPLAGELDRPAYGSLLAEPELYRARPIAMRVRVKLIKKLQPPQTARRDGREPNENEGVLWCLECYSALAKRGGYEPVIVLAAFPPTMGKPDRTSPDGEEAYDRSVPEAELAGVFHKLYSVQDPNGQWFDYPVILAWQIDRKGSTTAQPFPLKTFFAVAMVLLGYGILRWQIRRRDLMNRQEESYRLRAAESTTACSPQAVEVDPLLIQAAQDTRSGNTLTTERTIRVELGRRSYSVRVGAGMLERLGAMVAELPRASWAALIADSNVAGLYAAAAMKSLDTAGVGATLVVFPTGEEHKTLATFGRLMDSLFAITPAIDRDTVIVALGGGVTGDLAGFVAATALRGLRWLQCPTTLLADVDASVGGKTAIDHPSGKNLIGAFHQPQGVLIDVAALKTLPPEELRSGLAECVKHGMIADSTLLDFIEHNAARILAADEEILTELVARNVAIKAAVVSADEREASVRAHLNFGHTIGHAIEATVGFGSISHGQAVAMGMVSACAMALRRGLIDPAILQRLERLLKLLGLPTRRSGLDPDRIWQIMQHDKKARKGGVRMILPVRLGGVSVYDQIDQREVRESLDRLSETK